MAKVNSKYIDFGLGTYQVKAGNLPTDTTEFGSNLSSSDDTVQKALMTLSNLVLSMSWEMVTASPCALLPNKGFIANYGSQLEFSLPVTSAMGKEIKIAGHGSGGWKITQNSGQKIIFGNAQTTVGVTGFLSSTHQNDCVEMVCVEANNIWKVVSSVGSININ